MSAKDLRLEYASSGRATCKGCKLKLEKNEMRIGAEVPFHEHTTLVWRHLECFSLGRKYKDIDPLEIEGYYDLKKADKAKVVEYFEGGGQKKSAVDQLISAITDSEKKKKQNEDEENDETRAKQKNKKISTKKSKKAKESSSESESEDYDDDLTDSEDDFGDSETDNEASDSDYEREKINQRQKKNLRGQKNKKEKAQTKGKVKGKSKSGTQLNIGYTPEQLIKFKEYLEIYEKKTSEYLKSLLGANNQPKTGNKDELVLKCADGKLLGQIPLCSACGGGKLRFDFKTGIYKCPGYMDDDVFQHCGQKFTISNVKREPWIDDLI